MNSPISPAAAAPFWMLASVKASRRACSSPGSWVLAISINWAVETFCAEAVIAAIAAAIVKAVRIRINLKYTPGPHYIPHSIMRKRHEDLLSGCVFGDQRRYDSRRSDGCGRAGGRCSGRATEPGHRGAL